MLAICAASDLAVAAATPPNIDGAASVANADAAAAAGTIPSNVANAVVKVLVTFEFDDVGGKALVFPRKDMVAATE
jgi:hypothetical protein